MELDDTEETDELEKAAASGAAVPPREVRHTGPRAESARQEAARAETATVEERKEQRTETRPEGRTEPRPEERSEGRQRRGRGDRGRREHRAEQAPAIEIVETDMVSEESFADAEPPVVEALEQAPVGGRRWRGRRGRRGRGQAQPGTTLTTTAENSDQSEDESREELVREPRSEAPETTTNIHASAHAEPASSPYESTRPERAARREPTERSEPAERHSAKPEPFVLPGESLSKYGGSGAPVEQAPKPAAPAPAPATSYFKPPTLIDTPIEWDGSGLLPGESLSKHRNRKPESEPVTEPGTEIEEIDLDEELAIETTAEELLQEEIFEEELELEEDEADPTAKDAEPREGSASHRIDPATPSGFRLFGFGKKKPETEEPPVAAVAKVPAYAPGTGRMEEEIIEGEEFEATPRSRRHKPDAADLDDYEEQVMPSHARAAGIGDALEEARKIRLGDGEPFDEDEEDSEASGTQPARRSDRGERGGRGRRTRGQQPQAGGNRRGGPSRRSMQTTDLPVISDLLKPGQEILVQIAKEPIAKKGARITSHIALPGRFLVFMPTVSHVGVSRKIASDEERHRLKKILVHERGEASGGFIVRTAAEGASEEELRADLRFLMNLWNDIKQRSDGSKSPALIYHDLSLIERILRDQVSSNFSNIWVDSEADYERIVRFLNRFSPTLVRRVKLYTKETPMFEHFGIEDEISKALRSKVWLKSGGSIVINQTEALVAIDINTGKYVGKSARLEDTIFKTNLDAVPEIVRQIRLRDLGGIIVIDFIDMDERKNRFKVLAALEEALKNDRAPTKVLQFNDFGLVAITRKRVKQSLERTLSVPCPTCQATGMVKSPITVANEIFIELRKMKKHFDNADVLLRVHPETVKVLKQNNASWLVEFEELTGKNILVKSDATLHPEQFDIQG
jgi:ribonuclease G